MKSSMKRILFGIAALLLVVAFGACHRYTPSRSEVEQDGKSLIAGSEEFDSHQKKLRDRLDNLMKERQSLLQNRSDRAYEIGTGDVLKIDVFGFSEHSGEAAVPENGSISLPLVGEVDARGKTVERLQAELTVRFMRYIRSPKIRVSVNQYNSQRVSIVGSVVKPGLYPLKHVGYLLTELLAEVGGVKENGANRIYIIPATGSETWTQSGAAGAPDGTVASKITPQSGGVEIDLEELNGTLDKAPILIPLLSGDTIVVPEAGQFRVAGEVEAPGSFPVSRKTSSLSAVAAAGGFTYAANVNEVEVIRDIGSGKKAAKTIDLEQVAFQGGADVALREGDVVLVPSAPSRFRARQVVDAFRSILRGGVTGSIRYQ